MKAENKKITWKKVILVLLALVILQTLPVIFVMPIGSKQMSNETITVYYQEKDEKAAAEVFALLTMKADQIRADLGFEGDAATEVFLYHTQWQLAIREAGFATLLIAPSWHIGDSHNGNVMMVSPYTEVEGHDHESILTATLHEYVHSINHKTNPKLNYFWDNGLATFIAEQNPQADMIQSMAIPTVDQMQTDNGLTFANMGGYAFSYNYIEYLNNTYGWNKVVAYATGQGDYVEIFGKTEAEIHAEWCSHLQEVS